MTWDWLPWRRVRRAESMAVEAEQRLEAAHRDHAQAMNLAADVRRLKARNGFTDSIRTVFG